MATRPAEHESRAPVAPHVHMTVFKLARGGAVVLAGRRVVPEDGPGSGWLLQYTDVRASH